MDLCSHGSSLAPVDHLVCGFFDEFFCDDRHEVSIAGNLHVAYDFRSRFLYNNSILGVVSHVITKVSGESSGIFLRDRIFKPLGLSRTSSSKKEMLIDGNVATGYSVLNDGSLCAWNKSALEDGNPQGGAGYVRSTVRDMLTWAKAIMEAESDHRLSINREVDGNDLGSSNEILQQIPYIRTMVRPMIDEMSPLENSYALGWFRHMLPSSWLGFIGLNFGLFADPPLINASGCPRLTIAHWGEFKRVLTAFYTFPSTKSTVLLSWPIALRDVVTPLILSRSTSCKLFSTCNLVLIFNKQLVRLQSRQS